MVYLNKKGLLSQQKFGWAEVWTTKIITTATRYGKFQGGFGISKYYLLLLKIGENHSIIYPQEYNG